MNDKSWGNHLNLFKPIPAKFKEASMEFMSRIGTFDIDQKKEKLEKLRLEILKHRKQVATLGREQKHAYYRAMRGESFFLTGSGGRGKTKLIHLIEEGLKLQGKVVVLGAPTGVAAKAVRGQTLHHLLKIPVELSGDKHKELSILLQNNRILNRTLANSVDTLIIDEISMIPAWLFEFCSAVFKSANYYKSNQDIPFAGIQVLACGDFFQLPPVVTEKEANNRLFGFCFQSSDWEKMFPAHRCIELLQNFRQKSDPEFTLLLDSIRVGFVSPTMMAKLNMKCHAYRNSLTLSSSSSVPPKKKLEPPQPRAPTNKSLDIFAQDLFSSSSSSSASSSQKEKEKQNKTIPETLFRFRLFPKNDQSARYNTMREKALEKFNEKPATAFNGGLEFVPYDQKQLDFHEFQASQIKRIQSGHLYVSDKKYQTMLKQHTQRKRLKSMVLDKIIRPNLKIVGFNTKTNRGILPFQLNVGSRVMLTTNDLKNGLVNSSCGYVCRCEPTGPVVLFDDKPSPQMVIPQIIRYPCKEGEWVIEKFPLAIAWSSTIHKTQSLSLHLIDVDLGYVFAHGQAYVALSRVTSWQGLRISALHPYFTKATDPKVVTFYHRMFPQNPHYWPRSRDMTNQLEQLDIQLKSELKQSDEAKKAKEKAPPLQEKKKEKEKEKEKKPILPFNPLLEQTLAQSFTQEMHDIFKMRLANFLI